MKTNYFKTTDKLGRMTIPLKVGNQLRQLILSGELLGGTPLKQEELALQFNVSMSALREALKTLESEGLVKFYPNRGAVVTELSAEEAQEIFQIRILLELGALEFALPQIEEEDLEKAERILALLEKEENFDRWSELNCLFHEHLYEASGKTRLLDMIRVLHNNVERYMRLYLKEMHYQDQSQTEHRSLLEACKQRDIKKAKKLLKTHMEYASKMLSKYLLNSEK
ncbi:GntR family transcriptional regulator [Anaerosinus massiliensis]|uniref:GntR family transcriptional regulator n=1 Tax=Massilibacillus massiliensis TaxID=1806837 RepID=UPI000A654C80|nr:GntR family transcriptional regulator [Massilibacillus massiliensis]